MTYIELLIRELFRSRAIIVELFFATFLSVVRARLAFLTGDCFWSKLFDFVVMAGVLVSRPSLSSMGLGLKA